MRRYDLSQHAKDVIAGRNIRLLWLEQVLELVERDSDDPELTHQWDQRAWKPGSGYGIQHAGEPRADRHGLL